MNDVWGGPRAGAVVTATLAPAGRARSTALAVLCLAQFMLIVDVVVVNVALPSIRDDLGLAASRLQLVGVAYTLTFGSLLITFGRAGDLFGRRRLFLAGVTVFTVASLATGLAASEWQLVAARAAQGVGAAMVSPTALSLLMATFAEGEERNRAFGYWGAVGSGGAIVGQLLGGVLTDTFGWRAIFLVNVPVGIVTLGIATRHLRESRGTTRPHLEPRGAILLTAGLAAGIIGLTRIADGGTIASVAPVAIAAAVLLTGFSRAERHSPDPLVDRRLLRSAPTRAGNALLAVNAGMLGGSLFFTTLYLQGTLGYSPLAVGAAFAPITLIVLLVSPRIGSRVASVGAHNLLSIGFGCSAAGMALLARFPDDGGYLVDVLPALALIALGSAFSYAPTFVLGTTGVAPERQGVASGLLNASQEIGAAIGITGLATIAASTSADLTGQRIALVVAAAVMTIALVSIRRLGFRSAGSR